MTPDPSSSSQTSSSSAGKFVVSPDLEKKFPQLIALIRGSESMNDEERQYWVNILPAMTEEQIQNLVSILQNEKDQLAAIDAKYATGNDAKPETRSLDEIEKEKQAKNSARKKQEAKHLAEEEGKTEDILKQIES